MASLGSCHETTGIKKHKGSSKGKSLTIALAGNANVGKSVIFNQLTGSHQIIGNWPGKTVERAEGLLCRNGYELKVVDLPGIYSLSTFSMEELVSREYIAREKPDVIINVISAAVLERNLFFTLQLMEMEVPMIVCLNQMDIAESKGIEIDARKLETILGVPVVPTVAANGKGIPELIDKAIKLAENASSVSHPIPFGDGVESGAEELAGIIEAERLSLEYPARWVAIKLIEGDANIRELVSPMSARLIQKADALAERLESRYQQSRFAVVASARYALAGRMAHDVQVQQISKPKLADRLEHLTTHKVFGYLTAFIVVTVLLLWTFTVGTYLSGLMSDALSFFEPLDPLVSGTLLSILWNGVFGGFVAGATLVVPYVLPFYLMLAMLEDSGILTRVAFMMDSAMHQMGLHGKAIIPIILGYGCNVPAIYSTRIMGTRRERLLAAFAITFSPCAARTIVIFGLVAAFVSIPWALALYAIGLFIMFLATKLAGKAMPGDLTGMIMEMHSFKVPSTKVVIKQTWARTKSLIMMVFPIYMIGSAAVQGAYALGWLNPINSALSPLTVGWLGLPAVAGILLIFGAARKELILLMAITLFGLNLALVFTPVQLIVLALVGAIYPCMATIGTLTKEFGWKSAWAIVGANWATAILVGGIAARVLPLFFG
ncbi:ferrous iron transport protein B [Dehalogenimonas sp. 4OHTPN]|uniref:Ferrous iron transport protein B n=1 Tax=Dehalogenimonas sp. 4OHTPN TaxID=3166643 RepID=A0AAU8GD73_9CHLR